jgi:uncharacterized membrane protein YhaH (DUF805 family)
MDSNRFRWRPNEIRAGRNKMSFSEAIRSVLARYAVFGGRSRRSEYWFWTLAAVVVGVVIEVLLFISRPLGLTLELVFVLATFIPGLAVAVRRLHDTDRSGWWMFIALIPIIGTIVLIVFVATDGTPGPNKYGPSPKGVAAYPA